MLPKEYRLKKRSAFEATYRTGKTIRLDGITAFLGKEKNNTCTTKLGFVVSKKFHKRAVKRNRTKRLMRESCRQLIKRNNIPDRYLSIVFVASPKVINLNFHEIDKIIKKIIEKI